MKLIVFGAEGSLIGSRIFPMLFVTIAIYYILLVGFGYESVKYISVLSLIPLCLLIKNFNISLISLMSVLFLVIFDNDILNWTDSKIRPWYFIVMLALLFDVCHGLMSKKILAINDFFAFYSFLYFFAMSVFFFFSEDLQSKLYIAKYWLFSVGIVYILLQLSKMSKISLEDGLRFWQFTVLFSTLWGLLQFVGNVSGFAKDLLQHDWFNISPSGFFSERTWYGQYAAVGAILSFYFFIKTRNIIQLCMAILSLACVIISFSRSAVIPILAAILGFLLFIFFSKKISKKILYNLIVGIAVLVVVSLIEFEGGLDIFYLFEKFHVAEEGIQGRIEALDLYLKSVQQNPYGYIFGNGFAWNESETSSIGTAIGAKSSNVILMIFHIFGFYGAILCVLLILNMLIKYILIVKRNPTAEAILGFILFISFIGLSLVVPAHQYPSSLMVLFFSILIYKRLHSEA